MEGCLLQGQDYSKKAGQLSEKKRKNSKNLRYFWCGDQTARSLFCMWRIQNEPSCQISVGMNPCCHADICPKSAHSQGRGRVRGEGGQFGYISNGHMQKFQYKKNIAIDETSQSIPSFHFFDYFNFFGFYHNITFIARKFFPQEGLNHQITFIT